jgi:hypothetical protein
VAYVPIDYNERVGKSKVKLLRDSMKTLQYIVEAAIYYNPLKIFVLMTSIVIATSIASFLLALLIKLNVFFYVGVGGIISSAIIFSLGLIAVLLRQIMLKSSRLATDREPVEPPDEAVAQSGSHPRNSLDRLRANS